MAITLDLRPEVEAELTAQARAAGLSLDRFLSRELEAIAIAPSAPAPTPASFTGECDQWEKELDEWLGTFPPKPVLNAEALQRENWYPDRW